MRDVIVIGARCGGAPTAMLLAKKGYDVLLVDRARFPTDIAHGHFVHRHGPARLRKWGLLDRVIATGCPAIESSINDYGDYPLCADELRVNGLAFGYAPRRYALDTVLVEAAVAAGAELRQEYTVENLTMEEEQVTGIKGRDRNTCTLSTEQAVITVGADGRGSLVARRVHAPLYQSAPSLTFSYFSYWSGVASKSLEIYVRGDFAIFCFPTNNNLFAVFVFWPTKVLPSARANAETHYMNAVDQIPGLGERLRAGRREERIYAALDLPNFLRKPYGPGWALVGDAGCHKDPFLALGISDALRDAEFLAEAIDTALSGRATFDQAMAQYERLRNESTLPEYNRNLRLAKLEPLPQEVLRLRAAVRDDESLRRQYTLANHEAIPHESFFNAEMMHRLGVAYGP
jgi:flavin-dependent dehydrogenase